MINMLLAMIPKVLLSIGMKLITEKMLEELILWSLKKLSETTKTKVDDELYAMVDKHLNKDK